MTAPNQYSRLYWRFVDEFPGIYADDAALALWCRLLVEADMAWPASASLPYGTRHAPLDRLKAVNLVYLVPGGRFRIKGMDKERQARSDAGRNAAAARWRNADAMPAHADSNAVGNADSNAERNAVGNAHAILEEKRREEKRF